jgi:hypothetical protein
MKTTLADCSFCGKHWDAFDLVWSPTGKAICWQCVVSNASRIEEHGPKSNAPIHDTECIDFEELRRHWRVGRGKKGGSLFTHVFQRKNGRRFTAYLNEKTRVRMIVHAMVPVLPQRIDDDEE